MLKSFIEVAPESHFPIQNLPYGAYMTPDGETHLCTAIGEQLVDLFELDESGLIDGPLLGGQMIFQDSTLNYFMSMGKEAWMEARATLQALLSSSNPILRDDPVLRERVFKDRHSARMMLPVQIGDYTDFYSSEQHARNVGSMFRDPENALLPNWKHLPVGYHGRASSIVISGTDLHRPKGQVMDQDSEQPAFKASERVDFELEMGFFTGPGNTLGNPITVDQAEDHIFGLALLNDWSARDIQKWEYQPLGPFLAKNWATTISPWIVTMEALSPFKIPLGKQTPEPLVYLKEKAPSSYDIHLEVSLKSKKLDRPFTLCSTNYREVYWSMAQQLAHHTVTGCNVQPGDLYGSGTISGAEKNSYGSMLELAWNGADPVELPSGEIRSFLEDGDEVILSAYADANEYRIGFGEARGTILPPL